MGGIGSIARVGGWRISQCLRSLVRQADGLGRPWPHPAAFGDQLSAVVLPRGPRKVEQAGSLLERCNRIGIWIDEDVSVVERGDEANAIRQQHAVAEHVARHVADTNHRKRLRCRSRDIAAHAEKVALHRFPCAARGDTHCLVVVSNRPAGGERVA